MVVDNPTSDSFKVLNFEGAVLDANQTSRFKDRYVLKEQLGLGQFGVIRACVDKFTGEVFACKSISKDRLITQHDKQSVRLEIEIMTRLSGHPNVVDLKAVYEEEDYVHLVMELCSGGELFHQLEKYGRYSESQAKVLFWDLMQVVLYCHNNRVVHRDLKPENILLASKPATSSKIKLADFGLATYIKPGQNLHGTVGSPFYIAPEVLSGGYTQAADVWSAGVILYILLSGTPPFGGKTKSSIFEAVRAADLRFPHEPWGSISESAKELIRKMLCVNPLKRLTAEQVLAHPWLKRETSSSSSSSGALLHSETKEGSFMSRDQDISFGVGSDAIYEHQSPPFSHKSSFTISLHEEPSRPTLVSGGFSFSSNGGSSTVELTSFIPSMPSFSFCSPSVVVPEQVGHEAGFSGSVASADATYAGTNNTGKASISPVSSPSSSNNAWNPKQETSVSNRTTEIHSSKRNHTIGLGEFDTVVTKSVIRWLSCTHLPTASSSLRTSLVC